MLDSLQTTFAQLRRICVVSKLTTPLPTFEDNSKKYDSERSSILVSGHLRKSMSFSKTINSTTTSSSNIIHHGIHKISGFDLQLNLWLLTSSIYRESGQIENALVALDEAEKMLLNLSKIQHHIRNQESIIFHESGQRIYSSGFWKEADPILARFQADVALEVIFEIYQNLII